MHLHPLHIQHLKPLQQEIYYKTAKLPMSRYIHHNPVHSLHKLLLLLLLCQGIHLIEREIIDQF